MEFKYFNEWKESFLLAIKNPQIFWATMIFTIITQCLSVIILFAGNNFGEPGSEKILISYMFIQIVFFMISLGGANFIFAGMMNSARQIINEKKFETNDFFKNAKKDYWEYLGFFGILIIGYVAMIFVIMIITLLIFIVSEALKINAVKDFGTIIIVLAYLGLLFYVPSRIIFAPALLADFGVISQGLKFSWNFPKKTHQYKTMGVIAISYIIMGLMVLPFYLLEVIPTNFELTQITPQYATENPLLLALFFLTSYLSIFITIANTFFIYKAYNLYAPEAAKK